MRPGTRDTLAGRLVVVLVVECAVHLARGSAVLAGLAVAAWLVQLGHRAGAVGGGHRTPLTR